MVQPRLVAPMRSAAQIPAPPRLPVPPPQTPKPTFRGVAADQPETPPPARPAPLVMPSPTALGLLSAPQTEGVDWSACRRQLQDVGATAFQVKQVRGNCWLFSIQLSTAQAGRSHRIDAEGGSEAEAVAQALQAAKRWRADAR